MMFPQQIMIQEKQPELARDTRMIHLHLRQNQCRDLHRTRLLSEIRLRLNKLLPRLHVTTNWSRAGEQRTQAPTGAATGADTRSPGSSAEPEVAAHGVAAPETEELRACPRTHPQSGIGKENVYTGGTVKYGCLTSIGEPQDLSEPIGDNKGN